MGFGSLPNEVSRSAKSSCFTCVASALAAVTLVVLSLLSLLSIMLLKVVVLQLRLCTALRPSRQSAGPGAQKRRSRKRKRAKRVTCDTKKALVSSEYRTPSRPLRCALLFSRHIGSTTHAHALTRSSKCILLYHFLSRGPCKQPTSVAVAAC